MHIKNNREHVRTHRVTRYADGEFQQAGKLEWQEASCKLTYGGFKLWMWLADNSDGYEFDLSPTAIKNALKMPDNTYCRAKQNLIDNGYLVPAEKGWYDYYMYGRPDWHVGEEPYFQNGSIKYFDTSKMEGNNKVTSKMEASKMEGAKTENTSKMEGTPSKMEGNNKVTSKMEASKMEGAKTENTSKMEGTPSKMEVTTSKMEGNTPDLLPFWGDKYTYIQNKNIDTDGHCVPLETTPSASSETLPAVAPAENKNKASKNGGSSIVKKISDICCCPVDEMVSIINNNGLDYSALLHCVENGYIDGENLYSKKHWESMDIDDVLRDPTYEEYLISMYKSNPNGLDGATTKKNDSVDDCLDSDDVDSSWLDGFADWVAE